MAFRGKLVSSPVVVNIDDDPIADFSDDDAPSSQQESYTQGIAPSQAGTPAPAMPLSQISSVSFFSTGSSMYESSSEFVPCTPEVAEADPPKITPDRISGAARRTKSTDISGVGEPPLKCARSSSDGLQVVPPPVAFTGGSSSSTALPPQQQQGPIALPRQRPSLKRPEAPWNVEKEPLRMLVVDLDERMSVPPPEFQPAGHARQAPVVDLHGISSSGYSVLLHVHGFRPYFFVRQPPESSRAECLQAMKDACGNPEAIEHFEEVQRRPLTQYCRDAEVFFRVSFASHKAMTSCRGSLERGVRLRDGRQWKAEAFEGNVPLCLRLMVDRGIVGGGWVEVGAGKFCRVRRPSSTAQLEVDAHYSALVGHKADGEWQELAPLRLLSIRVTSVKTSAEGDEDRIVAAAAVLQVHGEEGRRDTSAWVVGTGGSSIPTDPRVRTCCSEVDLLEDVHRYILDEADPDVILGYDLLNKDLAVLLQRAQATSACRKSFGIGRLRGVASHAKNTVFETRQMGRHESKDISGADGRILFDVYTIFEREHRLSSYSFSALVLHFLGESRLKLHPKATDAIAEKHPSHLAICAMKDAELTMRLFDSQQCLFRYVEMARVTGVPIEYLLTRGQSIKVFSMLLRKGRDHDFVLPPPVRGVQSGDGQTYEGGEVLEPTTGWYDMPVITLDFASLYPSIMQKHNLCYSTLLKAPQMALAGLDKDLIEAVPLVGHQFVKSSVRRGLLPMVLEELLSARAAAKKAMKVEKDPMRRAVLDGRQLALKVSANSVYGFTGMSAGILPCQAIAESVTAYGRDMIQKSKKVVEENYGANGLRQQLGASVIYGDTDSVMITLRPEINLHAAFEFGKDASQVVSDAFGAFIKMEFEKVYYPFLLMGKKRYAGLSWPNAEKPGKKDIKGVEVVRRDWCDLVRQVEEQCLDLMLREGNEGVEKAQTLVKDTVQKLRQGKLDTRLLVLTKALSREGDYKAKMPHVTLCEKLRKRDPLSAPRVGDRVQFIYVSKDKAPAYERAEDPIYALNNGLAPDPEYYLDHQLKEPLTRLFKERLGSERGEEVCRSLFHGDHTRHVKSDATRKTGGLMNFVRVKAKCMGCGAVLQNPASTSGAPQAILCSTCSSPSKVPGYVLKQVTALRGLEDEMTTMLSRCTRCEASHLQGWHTECINVDCPIFFRRVQVKGDLKTTAENLEKLQKMRLDW